MVMTDQSLTSSVPIADADNQASGRAYAMQ